MSSYAFLFFTSLQQQVLKYQCGGSDREIFISKQSCYSLRALFLIFNTGFPEKRKFKTDKLTLLLY